MEVNHAEILLIPWEGQQSLLDQPEIFGKISVEIPPLPKLRRNFREIIGNFFDQRVREVEVDLLEKILRRYAETQQPLSSLSPMYDQQRSAGGSEKRTGPTPTTE